MASSVRKSDRTRRPEVLVCVLRSHQDKEILVKEKWYRIPLSHAPKRRPKYLAFYQPAIFGGSGKRIELYGRVKYWRIKRRIDLLPEEKNHPDSRRLYIQFILSRVSKLRRPLPNRKGLRVSFGFTILTKLRQSPDLRRVFDLPPIEDILAKTLKKNKTPFYRQYTVKGKARKYLRLDFALPCKKGWLNVECDGFRWHSRKKQQQEDKKRDNKLKKSGWTVLRISEEELVKSPAEAVTRIKKVVRKLGGTKKIKI